jgi:hypothetical protein
LARAEWSETTKFITAAVEILEAENPMTVRQLFYRLVSAGIIENTKRDYQYTSRMMTKAREDDRCPFEWIVDRSRPTYTPNVFTDAAAYAETVKVSYRKDYWTGQPNHVELWCEKDSITGSIQDVTDELGITLRVGRGFQSTTRVNEIAQHFARITKPIKVFFLGDHDPSGVDIERDVAARVNRRIPRRVTPVTFLNHHHATMQDLLNATLRSLADNIIPQRLAIFKEDIKLFNLPPLRIKASDTRSTRFAKTHGQDCVELDALPPSELRQRIRTAVESVMDKQAWLRAVAVEQVELANIAETAGRWFKEGTA